MVHDRKVSELFQNHATAHVVGFPPKSAFVDTNVFKWSALTNTQLAKRTVKEQEWLGKEMPAIRKLISLAKMGNVRLFQNFEVSWEGVLISTLASRRRINALWSQIDIETIDAPFKHSRVLAGLGFSKEQLNNLRENMLRCSKDARFLQIKKLVGASHEADAYHILSAERARLDYLVTMDKVLIKLIERNKPALKIKVCYPSEMIEDLSIKSNLT